MNIFAFYKLSLLLMLSVACSNETQSDRSPAPQPAKDSDSISEKHEISPDSNPLEEAKEEGEGEVITSDEPTETACLECENNKKAHELGKKLTNPQSIEQFIDFINSLPKPTTVNDVLSAFTRPIAVNATSNVFSAQGATGPESPRIFLNFGNLFLSFVADGMGSDAIEISQKTPFGDSIKGDLKFPITESVPEWGPYESVVYQNSPSCGGICHSDIRVIASNESGAMKYASEFIIPMYNKNVSVFKMRAFLTNCGEINDSSEQRCFFYDALFNYGEVEPYSFE